MQYQALWRVGFWQRTTCGLRNALWAVIVVLLLLVAIIVPPVVVRARTTGSGPPTAQWTGIITSRGDRIPDFSFCGYRASEQPLPSNKTVAAIISLAAQAGEQRTRIQNALNAAAASGGGVVALGAGVFAVSPRLKIASGVVLRGAGLGLTTLMVGQLGQDPLISFGSDNTTSVLPFAASDYIIDQFVPIGSSQVTVGNATGYQAGQHVFVQRQVTAEWVQANGMSDLVLNGQQQTWLNVRPSLHFPPF